MIVKAVVLVYQIYAGQLAAVKVQYYRREVKCKSNPCDNHTAVLFVRYPLPTEITLSLLKPIKPARPIPRKYDFTDVQSFRVA